ncbi:MAG: LysR family transcriptional regulator, partial [Lachnospiraceae bacterium]|nr:LysR family transcriptional regulator [Lachnospiraceae bacterium]
MDFRDLTYIAAIAKYQNITKAAESLYVTQPTLSKFLMATEDALGQKLFRKLGHKYVPTYAGERYLDYAKRILNLKNDLDTEMADIMKRDVGVLNVAFPRMRCTYMLPKSLPAFKKLHPNVQVNILEGTSAENDQRLINGQADIAFFSMPSDT